MKLDIWSDVACPWCYVGKRRLEQALRETNTQADVVWHAFELQPDMPEAGLPARDFYAKRFGGPDRWPATWERMTALGAADGITFDFPKLLRAPNTRLAHRAIKLARELGGNAAQNAVVEACFAAHFRDGVNISDRDALLGALVGIDPAQLRSADVLVAATFVEQLRAKLATDAALAEVIDDEQLASEIGITGVPFFIAEGRLAVSGAQPPEVMAGFLAKARELGTDTTSQLA